MRITRETHFQGVLPLFQVASKLFQNARAEYVDVLFSQRDLRDAAIVLIDTKRQQLSAVVNTYQALGGGVLITPPPAPQPDAPAQPPGAASQPLSLPRVDPLPAAPAPVPTPDPGGATP